MLLNTLLMALRELRANLLRTALTALGMIIGVAAVVAVVSVMQGVSRQVIDDLQSLVRNTVVIVSKREPGKDSTVPFTLADAEAVARDIRLARHVAPVSMASLTFSVDGREHQTQVRGTTGAYLDSRSWKLTAGRRFSAVEEQTGEPVCLLGRIVRKELFGQQDPVGAVIRSGTFSCRIVGLLASTGDSFIAEDTNDTILMPIRTFHQRLAGNSDVRAILVAIGRSADIPKVIRDIEALMRTRRDVAPGRPENFEVSDARKDLELLNSLAFQMATAISGIAAISLFVGGIGIMNVMLVAVTERTREIGIRLAVGAQQSDVLFQFLIEAVVLSLAGGIVGAVLGFLGAMAIGGAIGVPIQVTFEVLAMGFGVPTLIGIAFGFFPALRASRLDPIEALRYE
jgi:putative ABC transport system permease protein